MSPARQASGIRHSKILNLLLIITSLLGYLEWPQQNALFIFQAEADVLSKLFNEPGKVIHPLTLLPMAGQLLLFITLFQHRPSGRLTLIGLGGIAPLYVFILLAALVSLNVKMILSVILFTVTAILTLKYYRKKGN